MPIYVVFLTRWYVDYNHINTFSSNVSDQNKGRYFCELCQKRYSKPHELDTHFLSYEHEHAKRLAELRQLNKVKRSEEESVMREVVLENKEVKRGGFKRVFETSRSNVEAKSANERAREPTEQFSNSSFNSEEDYKLYDPKYPTV